MEWLQRPTSIWQRTCIGSGLLGSAWRARRNSASHSPSAAPVSPTCNARHDRHPQGIIAASCGTGADAACALATPTSTLRRAHLHGA